MKNNFLHYFKPNVLITLVVMLGLTMYMAKSNFSIAFSTTGTIGIVLLLISKYAWNKRPFSWLFWTNDFSGRYEGELKFKYIDANGKTKTGKRKHVKIINQNGSRISVTSFTLKANGTKSSPSSNIGMYVESIDDGNHFKLTYNYLNEGNSQLNFPPHYGTDVIKIINDGTTKRLCGNYYTDRDPQTRGEYIDMKWVSNELKHEF